MEKDATGPINSLRPRSASPSSQVMGGSVRDMIKILNGSAAMKASVGSSLGGISEVLKSRPAMGSSGFQDLSDAGASVLTGHLTRAGLDYIVSPGIYRSVSARGVTEPLANATRPGADEDPRIGLERRALQVFLTLLYCLYMARLQLSENEVVKLALQVFGSVGLQLPAVAVWKLTGAAHEKLSSMD